MLMALEPLVTDSELSRVSTGSGVLIATITEPSQSGGNVIQVAGVTESSTNALVALVTLLCTGDDYHILFDTSASTFNEPQVS